MLRKCMILSLVMALILSLSACGGSGNKIAFISDREGNYEIYVMDADGSNQQNLTNNPDKDA